MGPIVLNQVSGPLAELLRNHPSRPRVINMPDTPTPWEIAPEAEVLITRGLGAWRGAPQTAPGPTPNLRWVQAMSAGVEGYPRWLYDNRIVTCGRGIASVAIAEYVLAAMMHAEKRLDRIRVRSPEMWSEPRLGGLWGKSVGLLGYGSIGEEIARRTRAFGMETLYVRRRRDAGADASARACSSLAEMIGEIDYLVIAAPLTAETRGLVDRSVLARSKKGLHIVNVSRGAILDQDALLEALERGDVAGATLDVTSPEPLPAGHPLYHDDRVVLTPHISWSDPHYSDRFVTKIMQNYDAYARGLPLSDVVDPDRGY